MFEEVQKYVKELSLEKDILSNIMQGDLWLKKYCPLIRDKIVFPLILFFDEFQTGNPLGSHAGEQKFGGVYISLPCLPPYLNAKFEKKFVSTVCYSKHIKEFSNEKVFSKTVESLIFLSEKRISIDVNGQKIQIYFECILVVGDNLGINCICGFQISFNSNYYCRICNASSRQCQQMTVENKKLLRTRDSYEEDLLKNNAKKTGIVERCIFHELKDSILRKFGCRFCS